MFSVFCGGDGVWVSKPVVMRYLLISGLLSRRELIKNDIVIQNEKTERSGVFEVMNLMMKRSIPPYGPNRLERLGPVHAQIINPPNPLYLRQTGSPNLSRTSGGGNVLIFITCGTWVKNENLTSFFRLSGLWDLSSSYLWGSSYFHAMVQTAWSGWALSTLKERSRNTLNRQLLPLSFWRGVRKFS